MSTWKDQQEEQQYKRKARNGHVKRMSHDRKERQPLDLSAWEVGSFDTLVMGILELGYYVGLCYTRDRGAICVKVREGENLYETYVTKPEELYATIHDMEEVADRRRAEAQAEDRKVELDKRLQAALDTSRGKP